MTKTLSIFIVVLATTLAMSPETKAQADTSGLSAGTQVYILTRTDLFRDIKIKRNPDTTSNVQTRSRYVFADDIGAAGPSTRGSWTASFTTPGPIRGSTAGSTLPETQSIGNLINQGANDGTVDTTNIGGLMNTVANIGAQIQGQGVRTVASDLLTSVTEAANSVVTPASAAALAQAQANAAAIANRPVSQAFTVQSASLL